MTFPRLLLILTTALFGLIGVVALLKKEEPKSTVSEIKETKITKKAVAVPQPQPVKTPPPAEIKIEKQEAIVSPAKSLASSEEKLPDANRIEELFNKEGAKLPIVETITYKSRVAWQKGRPAWLSDYASHYHTSRHFIARSLNGKPDYLKQDLAEGNRFNVLRPDKNIQFYALIDLSRCRMWFYYDDLDTHERVLLKTYPVGLGRIDGSKLSGSLTPLGKYSLGNKIVTYKPKAMGHHAGELIEMVSVFGTRWIPFDKELEGCTAAAKGFGLHGLPWTKNANGEREEDRTSLGKYQSDGCVRMASEDIEEVFAIVITKPTIIEITKDFYEAKLPPYISSVK